jgi:hypothetical protein
MALIVESLCQAVAEANLLVNALRQHGAEIRGQGATVEVAQLFWDRLGHGQSRFASSEALLTVPMDQRRCSPHKGSPHRPDPALTQRALTCCQSWTKHSDSSQL